MQSSKLQQPVFNFRLDSCVLLRLIFVWLPPTPLSEDGSIVPVYFWFESIRIGLQHLAFFLEVFHFSLSLSHVSLVLAFEVLRVEAQVFFNLAFFLLTLLDDLVVRLLPLCFQLYKTVTLNSLLRNVKYFIFPLDYLVHSLVKWYLTRFGVTGFRDLGFLTLRHCQYDEPKIKVKAWTVILNVGLDTHDFLPLLKHYLLAVKVEAASLQQNLVFLSKDLYPHQHPAILTLVLINFSFFDPF